MQPFSNHSVHLCFIWQEGMIIRVAIVVMMRSTITAAAAAAAHATAHTAAHTTTHLSVLRHGRDGQLRPVDKPNLIAIMDLHSKLSQLHTYLVRIVHAWHEGW